MKTVAVLFARADSIYKTMPQVDVWDIERDALRWPGGTPVVAHPPCRAWGSLAYFAKPRDGEKGLALWAIDRVREFGGVLEHPAGSKLWVEKALPFPGRHQDAFGGYTLGISQHWWGHRAEKMTWLYIVGVQPSNLPCMPFQLGRGTHVISQSKRKGMAGWRPRVTESEREHTPPRLAEWLVEVARRSARQQVAA